jgi:hypothetical protein
MALLANSVPLSTAIDSGAPRLVTILSSAAATLLDQGWANSHGTGRACAMS